MSENDTTCSGSQALLRTDDLTVNGTEEEEDWVLHRKKKDDSDLEDRERAREET